MIKGVSVTLQRYRKRNRSDSGVRFGAGDFATTLTETELVLKIKKDELFDPHVLLPHAELNAVVYNSVNTFVEKYNFEGITVVPFCTSGSNSIGQSGANMEELAGSGTWLEGERFSGSVSEEDLTSWIDGLK